MCLFLSQLREGRAGNYGDIGLLGSGYRDTLNHNGIAVRATMMEAEFGVKRERISGEANMDVMPTKPR